MTVLQMINRIHGALVALHEVARIMRTSTDQPDIMAALASMQAEQTAVEPLVTAYATMQAGPAKTAIATVLGLPFNGRDLHQQFPVIEDMGQGVTDAIKALNNAKKFDKAMIEIEGQQVRFEYPLLTADDLAALRTAGAALEASLPPAGGPAFP